jgi:competence protein ComEA
MRRESAEVTAAARLRVEALGREIGRGDDLDEDPAVPVRGVVVAMPGRHSDGLSRLGDRVRERLTARLPDSLRNRFELNAAHLAAVAVLMAAALVVTAWSVLHAAPTATPVPMAKVSTATKLETGVARTPSIATPSKAANASVSTLTVDVAGKVQHPGIVKLPAGSRVIDAVRRAGGARRGVDLTSLNLARLVVDGEQILVGRAGGAARGLAGSEGSTGGTGSTAPAAGQVVNLNTATTDALDALPGVGPVTAQKIVDWRTAHGTFTAINDLLNVGGIGPKKLATLAPHVTV